MIGSILHGEDVLQIPMLTISLRLDRNNEIKFTGQFGETGVRYKLTVPKGQHTVLSRQVSSLFSSVGCRQELAGSFP
jgi:hypothetical protein